jgi:hypothetical protein
MRTRSQPHHMLYIKQYMAVRMRYFLIHFYMETTKFPSLLVGSYKEFGWRYTPGADPGFQVRGGALKKVAPNGGVFRV